MHACALDIDECASTSGNTLCQNGGSCMNTVGSFTCNCSSGFNGSRCETGAPPLLRIELTSWTLLLMHTSHDSQLSALMYLNSRIVYTWKTCLLCNVFCINLLSVDVWKLCDAKFSCCSLMFRRKMQQSIEWQLGFKTFYLTFISRVYAIKHACFTFSSMFESLTI